MDASTMNCSGQSAPAVASLACALRVGEEVFREALQKAPSLPKLADVGRAPATLADAISARDAKEEERRRREAVRKDVKIKGKQVTPLPAVVEQAAPAPTPGLHIGNVNESSAFWMFVEDYFRDITQEDIMALLPVAPDPEEDDCLTVPFFGRDPRHTDRSALAKGKQALSREEDDTLERRGRGRGAGKLDLRLTDTPAAPGSSSHLMMPQMLPLPLHLTPDALVQGMRPDGRQAANMLEACTDDEARSFCALAHTLGLLDEDGDDCSGLPRQRLDSHTLMGMDRQQLEKLLRKVIQLGELGEGEAAGAGLLGRQGGSEAGADVAASALGKAAAGPSTDAPLGEEDTQSSNKGPLHELPRAACGDFMHPYLRATLKRPCTAYVLNPCAGTGSLVESAQDDEDGGTGGAAAGSGGPGGKGTRGGQVSAGSGTYLAKTPAASRGLGVPKTQNMTPADAHHAVMLMQQQPSALDPNALALGSGLPTPMLHGGVTPQDAIMLLPQLPPMSQAQQQAQEDYAAAGGLLSAVTPPLGVGLGSTADKAAAARGGRARNSVNYSALAGKKDKERERELREREREERERAKTVAPKFKRKPGPRGGASWGSGGPGGGAAALAGLTKPPTNNPLALLNKAPLLFKDEPWLNATTAAVHAAVAQGGSEGALEEQWTQLDAGSDVMAMAPDDEVLAELLALQTELVQQVAINRARTAVVMEAVLTDLPLQRAANQQRAEMEEQIRMYLQRKAEVKRNLKREKRELEKRQALAALNEPASPRAMPGRPKKFAGLLAGGYDGMGTGLADGSGADGAPDAWRGALPTTSGGEGAALELMPAAEDFELVDSLAQRTHDEEALCAICGDGQSVDPNMIVFCERCDVAVHQHCYGVRSIPADEWLCWPCRLYEESQRAAGVSQNEIRPKRWEMEARGITHAELPGGSHAAGCCLCPVRSGAFKRTTDGKAWCHVVCALWHDGPTVLPVDAPDAIDNISAIKPERWRSPCGLCQRVAGAVVKCNFGHCQAYFHPLCGRRAGNYLVARIQPGSKALRYRAYCHNHSEGQRNKDQLTGAAARISDVYPTAPPGPKPLRRGASSAALLGGGSPGDGGEEATGLSAGTSPLPYTEPDPVAVAAAAAGPGTVPGGVVKRRFGRPPKIQKQQQLLQLQLASLPPNPPNVVSELPDLHQTSLPPSLPPGPQLPLPVGAHGTVPSGLVDVDGSPAIAAGLPPAPAGRPPLPRDRLSLSAMARRKATATPAAAAGAAASSSSSGAPGGLTSDAAADTAAAGGPTSGRASVEPVFGIELQGHRGPGGRAKGLSGRNTGVLAAGAGSGGTSLEGPGGDGGGLGAVAETVEAGKGFRPGRAKGVGDPAPKATSSKTNSGAATGAAGAGPSSARAAAAAGTGAQAAVTGKPRPSSSGAGQGAAAGTFATASSAPAGGSKQRGNKVAIKEEPPADADAVPGPSPTSAAAAAAATARAAAAAAVAAAGGSGGLATLERLAYLEHQRSMLGRWGPSSVRQELELLRTMADTVRRRERCKKAQYRLLREALSGQDSQPAAALAFLESWEWPECGGSPFSTADLQEPPPVTVLDCFLEANRAAAAEGTEGPSAAGLGATSGGGVGGGVKRHRSVGADSAAGSGGGAGEDMPPTKRLKLKELSPASGVLKEFSKETMKEIMSGRDWRRRVVMVDGKWVPRLSEGRGHNRACTRTPGGDGVSSSSKASRDEGAEAQAEEAEGATPAFEEEGDEEEFVDAEEGFPEAEGDVGMTDTGQEAGAGRAGDGGGDSGSRTTSTVSDRRADGGIGGGGGGGGGGGAGGKESLDASYEGGGEVHIVGRAASELLGGGAMASVAEGHGEMDVPGSGNQDLDVGGGVGGSGGDGAGMLGSPRRGRADQWDGTSEPQEDGVPGPEQMDGMGGEVTPDLDLGLAEVFAAAGPSENDVEGGADDLTQEEETGPQFTERSEIGLMAEAAAAAAAAGGHSAAVSNASPSQRASEDDNASSDDAPIAALSRGVKLPREARPLMSERTADAVNAKLPRGYRFEKAP